MNISEYQQFVLSKMNPETLETKEGMLMCALLGLIGETGELADHIKKWCYHNHELDLDYVRKELGDIGFYWNLGCSAIDENTDDIVAMNVAKLEARYPSGFSVEDSKLKRDELG